MRRAVLISVLCWAGLAVSARGGRLEDGIAAHKAGDHAKAAALLAAEADAMPSLEAFRYLGLSLRQLGRYQEAIKAWESFKLLADTPAHQRLADEQIAAARQAAASGPSEEPREEAPTPSTPEASAKDLLDVADDWIVRKTPHFTVKSYNAALSDLIATRAEQYLQELLAVLLEGRAWPGHIPITIYKNHADYVRIGGNIEWSGGIVQHDADWGKTLKLDSYQIDRDGTFNEPLVDRTLPHELTHVIVKELFGQATCPLWLNEGLAQTMEQNRTPLIEMDQFVRMIASGRYIRLRDLFRLRDYPKAQQLIHLFYQQSELLTRYLIGTLSQAQLTRFLADFKAGKSHAEAIAQALGVEPGDAVNELEDRWIKWVQQTYRRTTPSPSATAGLAMQPVDPLFAPVATRDAAAIEAITRWQRLPFSEAFAGFVKPTDGSWQLKSGRLVAAPAGGATARLALTPDRLSAPHLAVGLMARRNGTGQPALGVAALDPDSKVLAFVRTRLRDDNWHELFAVVQDSHLALYDGSKRCLGMTLLPPTAGSPVRQRFGLAIEADGPVALRSVELAELP